MTDEHLELQMKEKMDVGTTDLAITLTATLSNGQVSVSGDGGANLPHGSGSHRFNFSLVDHTELGVTFLSLDAADNCTTCPPPSGMNSQQIHAISINGTTAEFTDSNSGNSMPISYQWNFSCNNSNYLPITYDPIINNGGSGVRRV